MSSTAIRSILAAKHALAEKFARDVKDRALTRKLWSVWNTRVDFRQLRSCDVRSEAFSRDLKIFLQDYLRSAGMEHIVVSTARVSVIDHRHTSGDFWSYGDVLVAGPLALPFLLPLTVMAFVSEACKKIGHAFRPELEFYVEAENRGPQRLTYRDMQSLAGMSGMAFSS